MAKELKPFHVEHREPLKTAEPDLEKAREIQPFLFFGSLPHAGAAKGLDTRPHVAPVVEAKVVTKKEVESPAGSDDPKVLTSSVIVTASPSELDSSGSGTQTDQTTNETPIHPSTLSASPESPVVVEKDQNPLLPPL